MGQPLNGREAVSVGDSDDGRSVSVTGVGVPNVLLTTVNELERGDVLGSRYQIEAVIGTGGSGRVLRAFDRESRMPVALKILRPEFASDPVWTERFSRELRIGRTITHPNVCRVFDIGDADGHKFLSIELASRGSIRADVPKLGAARVTPTRPLRSWAERVADAQAVVEGVAALHAAGIVHRDLKPENILRMEDGRLVVTDFGLATDPDAHGNTVMVGTPSYMAPEVVMGDPATKRSDVWGLGVVLHEILFGCRPQWKPAGRGYRKFVLPDEVATPVQRATADLCGRCADDSAELRPPSAVELRDEWARALRGKRRLSRTRTRQIAWGVAAVAAFGALAVVRERWSNKAQASLSSAATPMAERVLKPTGTPEDWSKGARTLASFAGRVHCLVHRPASRTVGVIWGEPRRAEQVDISTGRRTESDLLPATFQTGCPEPSPDGNSLLFEQSVDGTKKIFLAPNVRGEGAKELTGGFAPHWLPNGQEFSFTFDSRHAAIFSVPTKELSVVADSSNDHQSVDTQFSDPQGQRLGVLYTTESFGSVLAVHALPGLEVIKRLRVPQWSRSPRFEGSSIRFTAVSEEGLRQVVSWDDTSLELLRNVARVPSTDIGNFLATDTGHLFVTRTLRFDLAREDGRGRLVPLTSDGNSARGSLASDGTLVIQRKLPNFNEVIVLRDGTGSENTITDGPHDVTPSFLNDGTGWLYAKTDSAQIVECNRASKQCSAIHTDALVPVFPTSDPSDTRIAYITALNVSRVRIINRSNDGHAAPIDLGPAMECGPVWTSEDRLWVVGSSTATAKLWHEVDVKSQRRTGVTRIAKSGNPRDKCPFPPDVRASGGQERVIPILDEQSVLAVRATTSQH